jgi:hypothetical protein
MLGTQLLGSILCKISDLQNKIEDTKGAIRSRKSEMTDNTVTKRNRTKGQTIMNKTLCRKQNIKQHESILKYYVYVDPS